MGISKRPDYLIDDAAIEAWRWPNFTPAEFACKGTGRMLIVPAYMDKLQRLRTMYGRPIRLTSGYRTPEHNAMVSTTGQHGPHVTARAIDIAVAGEDAVDLLELSFAYEFTGFGIKQHGPHASRFIHLDDLTPPDFPRPMIWSYP